MVALVGLVGIAVAGSASRAAPTRAHATTVDPSGQLFGVSCASSTYCLAVGTTAASWDGRQWHIVHLPHAPAGTVQTFMNAVSCPAVSDCIVVGDFQTSRGDLALAEHWNGQSWSPVAVGSETHARLDAVSCPTTAWCMTTGSTNTQSTQTLAGIWNGPAGGGWRPTASPNGKSANVIRRLSCASSTVCVGLGSTIDEWNGTAWQTVPTDGYGIVDVSCLGAVDANGCTYLGLYGTGADFFADTLAYDGTGWHSVGDIHGAKLVGNPSTYACGSNTSCVAVGQQTVHATGNVITYAQHWNGSLWTAVPTASPNPPHRGLEYDALFGVTCVTGVACVAVGRSNQDVLAEHWNGRRWTNDVFTASSP
jgi:hypothetical protein